MTPTATGLVFHSRDGTRFLFDPGALCLELLYSGGPDDLAHHEVLHRPRDLSDWLARTRLGLDSDDVHTTPGDLAAGRTLRDALWRVVRACAYGTPPEPGDLAEINRAAAAPPLVPRIAPDGSRAWDVPATAPQALSTIARDAVELLTGRHADRIRECGADGCRLVFVDTSRPGRRRWCTMERCGNRHKVRALRARRDAEGNASQ